MGYEHRARKVACANCGKKVAWFWKGSESRSDRWRCECGALNLLKPLPQWPEVPRALYIGAEKLARFKVYPVPPECPDEQWAQPYSIRSFVFQVSRKLAGCSYRCHTRGRVMDETVFTDLCSAPSMDDYECDPESWDCHMVSGWTTGNESCPLWERVAKLCQTDTERKFLHWYLRYVKDRQYPMLIPQTWIGIAERRRPDFVAFVPLQYWKYRWIAIQLDGAHREEQALDDAERDDYVRQHDFEVVSLKPTEKGYFEEVRKLVEQIENWMTLADTNPWEAAVEAKVMKVSSLPDVPF